MERKSAFLTLLLSLALMLVSTHGGSTSSRKYEPPDQELGNPRSSEKPIQVNEEDWYAKHRLRFKDNQPVLIRLIRSKRRSKRASNIGSSSPGDNQFTHHAYGHYGHQSSNYAHYGHETSVTGNLNNGSRSQVSRQYQESSYGDQRSPHSQSTQRTRTLPSVNGQPSYSGSAGHPDQIDRQSYTSSFPGSPLPGSNYNLHSQQFGGYNLNLPLGLQAGSAYRSGLTSGGGYGAGAPGMLQPPCCGPKTGALPGTAGLPTGFQPGIDGRPPPSQTGDTITQTRVDQFGRPILPSYPGQYTPRVTQPGQRPGLLPPSPVGSGQPFSRVSKPGQQVPEISSPGRSTGIPVASGQQYIPGAGFPGQAVGVPFSPEQQYIPGQPGRVRLAPGQQYIPGQPGSVPLSPGQQFIPGQPGSIPLAPGQQYIPGQAGSVPLAPGQQYIPGQPGSVPLAPGQQYIPGTPGSVPLAPGQQYVAGQPGSVPLAPGQQYVPGQPGSVPLAPGQQYIPGQPGSVPIAPGQQYVPGQPGSVPLAPGQQYIPGQPGSVPLAPGQQYIPGQPGSVPPAPGQQYVPGQPGSVPLAPGQQYIPGQPGSVPLAPGQQYIPGQPGSVPLPPGQQYIPGQQYVPGQPGSVPLAPGQQYIPGQPGSVPLAPGQQYIPGQPGSGSLAPGQYSETGTIPLVPGQQYPDSIQQAGELISVRADDTAASQTQIQTGYEGTAAEASSQGRFQQLGSQTQVQGGYSGNGSFSAQAQSGFTGGLTQSQVRGGRQGGTSGATAQVERVGSAQSQLQVGQPSGAASGSAQGSFLGGSTQVQAQSSRSGSSAGAQAQSRGISNSQAQVNVNGETVSATDGFQGSLSANAQGGHMSAQTQTQLQGGFDSGRTYLATAQGGFDSTGTYRGAIPAAGSIPGTLTQPLEPLISRQPPTEGRRIQAGQTAGGLPYRPGFPGRNLSSSDQISDGQRVYPDSRALLPSGPAGAAARQPIPPNGYTPTLGQAGYPGQTDIASDISPESGQLSPQQPTSLFHPRARDSTIKHPGLPGFQDSRSAAPFPGQPDLRTRDSGYPAPSRPGLPTVPGYPAPGVPQQPDFPGALGYPAISSPQQPGLPVAPRYPAPHLTRYFPGMPTHGTQDHSLPSGQPSMTRQLPGFLQPSQTYQPDQEARQIPGFSVPIRPHSRVPAPSLPDQPGLIGQIPGFPAPGLPVRPGYPTQPGLIPHSPPSSLPGLPSPDQVSQHLIPSGATTSRLPGEAQDFKPQMTPHTSGVPSGPRTHPGGFGLPPIIRPNDTHYLPTQTATRLPTSRYPQVSETRPSVPGQDQITDLAPRVRPSAPRTPKPDGLLTPTRTNGQREASCCQALRDLRNRCCDVKMNLQGATEPPPCCSKKPSISIDYDTESDEENGGCRVVKAICYIVYKPAGKARICKPTAANTCR